MVPSLQNYGLGSIGYKCRMIRLSVEQLERIRDHFHEEHIADAHPARKPIPTRRVLQAVLWILNTGAQWHMLPQSYPYFKTVHRRFQTSCSNEVLRRVLTDVANELRDKRVLDEEESFIDATFAMAKGGGAQIGPTKRGKAHENRNGDQCPASPTRLASCCSILSRRTLDPTPSPQSRRNSRNVTYCDFDFYHVIDSQNPRSLIARPRILHSDIHSNA